MVAITCSQFSGGTDLHVEILSVPSFLRVVLSWVGGRAYSPHFPSVGAHSAAGMFFKKGWTWIEGRVEGSNSEGPPPPGGIWVSLPGIQVGIPVEGWGGFPPFSL